MGKRGTRSIEAQMHFVVTNGAHLGDSKRAHQHDGTDGDKIFGVKHLNAVYQCADRIAGYCRDNGIRRVCDLTPEQIRDYIQSRAVGQKPTTIDKQISYVRKIERMAQVAYPRSGINWQANEIKSRDFISREEGTGITKDQSMSRETSDKIVAELHRTRSGTANAVDIGRRVGFRANECGHMRIENIRLDARQDDPSNRYGFGYIIIPPGADGGAKGGRARVVPILSVQDRNAIKAILSASGRAQGRVVTGTRSNNPQAPTNALEAAVRRAKDRLGVDEESKKGNCMHAMRKDFAQRVYDLERQGGADKQMALVIVNQLLGHGDDRQDLSNAYVLNQW